MERILTVEQMRAADDYTVNTLGFSRQELVERAGACVANEIIKKLRGGRVLVCIGKGNNGEDGKVVAKILSAVHGFTVVTMSVANGIFKMFDKKFDVIVDCIFGTGLHGEVTGKYKTAIEKINSSGAYVVSCDIPSGINGDNGKVMGVAVKANMTIAIQEYKLGHFLNDGPDYCGTLIAKDIGISIWGDDYVQRFTDDEAKKFFPPLKRNVNKGSFGKVAVIGGSKKYPSSPLLSLNALTAFKAGNGYSMLVVPSCLAPAAAFINPECTFMPMTSDENGFLFDENALRSILGYDAICFGMGAGITEENYKILSFLLKNYEKRLVIDADGLNVLSEYGVEILNEKRCDVVLTPHIGEFSRLIRREKGEVENNSVILAKSFAEDYNVTVVLKSAATVITDGKEVYVNTTGNAGMAKAGSGDVLSGFLSGMLAREFDCFDCCVAACYVFGKAGDIAKAAANEYTMTASDIVKALPEVINRL